MRRLAAVLVITMASLCFAAPPSSAGLICDRTVTIENISYSPASIAKVAQAELFVLCWHNSDSVDHTATSNTGLFDTGHIASDTDAGATFYGSGTYRYHCEVHPSMAGRLNVRPGVSDASITLGDSIKLTVGPSGVLKAAPSWDVERRRNDGPWIRIRTGTPDPIIDVQPLRVGTFRFRARTHLFGSVSGWSPVRIVTVSAA